MTLEIYKITIFSICASIGIQFVELIGLIPNTKTGYADTYVEMGILGRLNNLVSYMTNNALPEDLTYLSLTLATFGLLVFTLGYMLALFAVGYFMTTSWIDMIFPDEYTVLKAGFSLLILIVYTIGYMQYKANTPLKQF